MTYGDNGTGLAGGEPEPGRGLMREEAYRALKELLVMGHRAPEPYLSERKLAKQLGMSNTPVRSAIERLEAEGYITITPQQGILVRELTAKEIADQYEVREALEPFVLRKLSGHLAPEQAGKLRENLRQQGACLPERNLTRFIELDSDFHLLFCEFLGNEAITRTLLQLQDRVRRVLLRIARHVPERLERSLPEHVEIAEAVIAGDGERAATAVRRHLERGEAAILPITW